MLLHACISVFRQSFMTLSVWHCMQEKIRVPPGFTPAQYARVVVKKPEYTQYENGLRLLLHPIIIERRELAHIWTEHGGFCNFFLMFAFAAHLSSFTPHHLSAGLQHVINTQQSDPNWNDSSDKQWTFIEAGGLHRFTHIGTEWHGPMLEAAQAAIRESFGGFRTATNHLTWNLLRTQDGKIPDSPGAAFRVASRLLEPYFRQLNFIEHTPKTTGCKRKQRYERQNSQGSSQGQTSEDIESIIQKLQNACASLLSPSRRCCAGSIFLHSRHLCTLYQCSIASY
jgi:hypothetical protein